MQKDKFTYENSEAIFNELRVASKGGTADYYGITYKRIEDNMGVFGHVHLKIILVLQDYGKIENLKRLMVKHILIQRLTNYQVKLLIMNIQLL